MGIVAACTAGAGAFASVYGAFANFDSDQSVENRKFVHDWLLGLQVDEKKWQQFFQELFSTFFGDKHFSLKCVRRSFALSSALIIAIYFVWYLGNFVFGVPDIYQGLYFGTVLQEIVISIICAAIIDYLSLWKTRILLTTTKPIRNMSSAVGLVFGDFIATTILFGLVNVLAFTPFWISPWDWAALDSHAQKAQYAFNLFVDNSMLPFWFLYAAALLTSAWLWIYLIVAFAMRTVKNGLSEITLLFKCMDVENHPVRTIGYVAATVSAVIVGVFTLI